MARAPSPANIPGSARLQFLSLPCFCRSPEPSEGEAEGCRTASLSHCHSERLQPRGICCRQSSWYVWCGPYCPRNSVPDDVGVSVLAHAGTDYARTAWCAILSRFVRKGEAIPCGGHSCPRDPIPDDVGASVLARAPLTIVILEEAESCARAGLPTKDLRISGLPRMLRRNLVQSKPGTARLLVLEPALSDPKGAEQLPFLIVIPPRCPRFAPRFWALTWGDTLRANRSQLPRHRRLKESVHVLS